MDEGISEVENTANEKEALNSSNEEAKAETECEKECKDECKDEDEIEFQEMNDITHQIKEFLLSTLEGFMEHYLGYKHKYKDHDFRMKVRAAVSMGAVWMLAEELNKAPNQIANDLKISFDEIYYKIRSNKKILKEVQSKINNTEKELGLFLEECTKNNVSEEDLPRLLKEKFPNFIVEVKKKNKK